MFNFRIITCADGTQIINSSLKTPYSALTPNQIQEYIEMDSQIAVMDRMKRKARREANNKLVIRKNLFYKIACKFGLA